MFVLLTNSIDLLSISFIDLNMYMINVYVTYVIHLVDHKVIVIKEIWYRRRLVTSIRLWACSFEYFTVKLYNKILINIFLIYETSEDLPKKLLLVCYRLFLYRWVIKIDITDIIIIHDDHRRNICYDDIKNQNSIKTHLCKSGV